MAGRIGISDIASIMVMLDSMEAMKNLEDAGENTPEFLESCEKLKRGIDKILKSFSQDDLDKVIDAYTQQRNSSNNPWLKKLLLDDK